MLRMKIDTRRTIASLPLLPFLLVAAGCSSPPEEAPAASTATVFEGARLIVGDGGDPIENATFIVDGTASSRSARPARSRCRKARQLSISAAGRSFPP